MVTGMKETPMATKSEPKFTDRHGVVPGVVHLALDVAERGQSTAVAVLQDARIELRTALDGGIDLAEKVAAGALRFARKLVHKLDDASNETLVGAERILSGAVKSARETTRAAGELATTAASGVAGSQAA
jgi:hypothetical protein